MANAQDSRILTLTTTVGSDEDARRLARALVEQRLAACIQLDRIESHYRWEGRLCAEPEVRLTIKSVPERLAQLQAFLSSQHPYQLPQLAWRIDDASASYADWVRQEVSAS